TNWAGSRSTPSSRASPPPWTGTWPTRNGCSGCWTAATASNASAPRLDRESLARARTSLCGLSKENHDGTQRHHPGRRLRHPALSDHQGRQQAAAAGVRQADDLLPAQRADAGGHPRSADHQYPARAGAVPEPAGRRLAVGHGHPLRGPAKPRWLGPGLPDRPRLRRRPAQLPGAGRQHLPRPWPGRPAGPRQRAHRGRDRVRLLGQRSGALRRGRVRCQRQGGGDRGEAGAAALQLRGDRPVLLRRQGPGLRRRAQAFQAWRAGDHRPQQALPGRRCAVPGATGPRLRLARHRHPPVAARGFQLHPDHPGPPGPAGVLPGGNRVRQWLDRRRPAGEAGRATVQERLRPVPAWPGQARGGAREGVRTSRPGGVVSGPAVFGYERGVCFETWNAERFGQQGLPTRFVQSNVSTSTRGVLRGLHYQWPRPQGKLVSVLEDEVYDVAVDIRRGSPTFGRWEAVVLSAENRRQFWIPEGFAHGFAVLSGHAVFNYMCTDVYVKENDAAVRWN